MRLFRRGVVVSGALLGAVLTSRAPADAAPAAELTLGGIRVGLGRSGGSATIAPQAAPVAAATSPPPGVGDPVGAYRRFSIVVNKAEPWTRVIRCAFLGNDRILVQPGAGATGFGMRRPVRS